MAQYTIWAYGNSKTDCKNMINFTNNNDRFTHKNLSGTMLNLPVTNDPNCTQSLPLKTRLYEIK